MSAPTGTGLLDALPFGAALLDAAGVIVHVNPALEALLETSASELAGRSFFPALHRVAFPPEAESLFVRGLASGKVEIDLEGSIPAEESVPVVVRLRSFRDGRAEFVLACFEDVREARRLSRIAEAHEAAIATLAFVRHEMNNSLMGVLGLTELLLMGPDLPDPLRAKIEALSKEAGRLRDGVAQLGSIRRT